MASINWTKIRAEIKKHADLDKIKKEVLRLKNEIQSHGVRDLLSPAAKRKLRGLEQKYKQLVRQLHRAQRELDREVNRFMRSFKTTRNEAEKKLESLFQFAKSNSTWVEKASDEIQKRIHPKPVKKTSAKKTPVKKAKTQKLSKKKTPNRKK